MLAAVLMLERCRPVHLLSFHHNHMSQLEKTTRSALRLQERFGKEAVLHQWIDMTALWNNIKKESPHPSIGSEGLFALLLKPCLACKAAMHRLTLDYCQEHGIETAADGAHPDGAILFPEQMSQGLEILGDFYEKKGIHYLNPVYKYKNPDEDLFQRKITVKKKTKNEHIYYSNQFACHVGLLAYLHHFLTLPFDKGKKKTFHLSIEYLERSLELR